MGFGPGKAGWKVVVGFLRRFAGGNVFFQGGVRDVGAKVRQRFLDAVCQWRKHGLDRVILGDGIAVKVGDTSATRDKVVANA